MNVDLVWTPKVVHSAEDNGLIFDAEVRKASTFPTQPPNPTTQTELKPLSRTFEDSQSQHA